MNAGLRTINRGPGWHALLLLLCAIGMIVAALLSGCVIAVSGLEEPVCLDVETVGGGVERQCLPPDCDDRCYANGRE